ncbi:choline/ethanolamine kinase [Tetranychus urticae]|uniref:Major facilitator superfamily (MFS) profile domain-containing protein n=1 Tax=Tetranychus urticae TaxID=32264 RepID=T1KKM3_TETUR|nr:choline/ethanolamine kinase [Tetranychus urticae]
MDVSKKYVAVGILCFINLINYIDRFAVAGVLPDIKDYYSLSNAQGGLLQTAFIFSYIFMVPIFGLLADRYSRKKLMAMGLLFWFIIIYLGSFIPRECGNLFIFLRAMVGIGEASYSTIAPTIIADLFYGSYRTKLLGSYFFAIPVGSTLGYVVGDFLAKTLGSWKYALRLTPLLGFISVFLMLLYLEEPPRGQFIGVKYSERNNFKVNLSFLSKFPSYIWSTLFFTFLCFTTHSLLWITPLFIQAIFKFRDVHVHQRSLTKAQSMIESNSALHDKAYNLCRQFLSGSWKDIKEDELVFHSISGGLSNSLYRCSLPSTHTPLCGEPSQVLLRMYGQLHSDDPSQNINKMTESVIFMMLSERKLGPKLYGIFPEGRLEEYIPAQALTCEQLRDPVISATIAHKLSHVHQLDVPINKEPTWLFDTIHLWLDSIHKIDVKMIKKDYQNLVKELIEFPYEEEITWLRNFLSSIESPVVFCHNDLQEGNILLPTKQTKSRLSSGSKNQLTKSLLEPNLIFIDFEYCAYNYRGHDIANHFNEWTMDYSAPEFPHFYYNPQDYPSETQRRFFVKEYIKAIDKSNLNPEIDTEDHILREAEIFTLASHFLWILWSIDHGYSSKIAFGYWEYGQLRLKNYLDKKRELIDLREKGLL